MHKGETYKFDKSDSSIMLFFVTCKSNYSFKGNNDHSSIFVVSYIVQRRFVTHIVYYLPDDVVK